MPQAASEAVRKATGAEPDEQLDHLISLELGGSNDTSNLNNEKLQSNGTQPSLEDENRIAKLVANGDKTGVSYIDGQKMIARLKGVQLPDDPDFPSSDHPLAQYYPKPAPNQTGTQAQADTSIGTSFAKNFPGLTQTLADLQTNPLNLGKSIKDIISTPFTDAKQASDAFNAALQNLIDGVKQGAPASKDISNGLQAATAYAGGVLTPLTTWFSVANKIPIIGDISKLLFNVPFSALGDASGDIGVHQLNTLPISDEAKQNLAPGVRAISTLAGQIVGGKYIAVDVLDTLTKQFGSTEAQTIVSKAKEVAKEAQATTPIAPTDSTNISTETPHAPTTEATLPKPEVPNPIERTDETKTSGVAKSIEAKAIESGLTRGFKNLADFKSRNVQDQVSRVADFITNDFETAKDVVRGNEALPEGMSSSMFLKGMEEYAHNNSNVELLRELASSPLTSDTSIHASEMRLLQERDPESAVAAIKDVQNSREETATRKLGKNGNLEKAKSDIADQIKQEIKKTSPTKQNWSDFVKSIQC